MVKTWQEKLSEMLWRPESIEIKSKEGSVKCKYDETTKEFYATCKILNPKGEEIGTFNLRIKKD